MNLKDEKVKLINESMEISQYAIIKHFKGVPDYSKLSITEKTYHGWLRPYMLPIDTYYSGRWMYWLDIRETQQVENKPIPYINFLNSYDKDFSYTSNMIKKCLDYKYSYENNFRLFPLFIDWLLYAWGSPLVKKMPEGITEDLNKFWYENFDGSYFCKYPADYFVIIASQLYSSKYFNSTAFYPTPSSVVECMSQILFCNTDKEKLKYMKVNEPCCGSGIMLLYASNYSLRLYGQDVDLLMVKLSVLNGYFYAPWMVEMDDKTDEMLEKMSQKYNSNIVKKSMFDLLRNPQKIKKFA